MILQNGLFPNAESVNHNTSHVKATRSSLAKPKAIMYLVFSILS